MLTLGLDVQLALAERTAVNMTQTEAGEGLFMPSL